MSFSKKVLSIFKRDIFLFFSNIFTGIIIARTLGPKYFGLWMILQLIQSYSEAFGRTKSDVASIYFYSNTKFNKGNILLNLNFISIITWTLLFLLFIFNYNFIYNYLFQNNFDVSALQILCVFVQVLLQFFNLNYIYYHLANDNIITYNKMTLINALVNSLTAIILLLVGLKIWALILASLLGLFCSLFFGIYKKSFFTLNINKVNFKLIFLMIKYSFNFYLAGIINHFSEYGTRTIIISLMSPSRIVFLGQAQNIGKLLSKIPDAINNLLFSKISKSENTNTNLIITCKAFRITFLILLFAGTLLFLSSNFLITTLYGDIYITTSFLLKISIPTLIFFYSSSILTSFFNGSGKAYYLPLVQILPVLLQIALSYFFSLKWNLKGAMIAISIGQLSYSFILIFIFLKVSKINIMYLIPNSSDFQYTYNFIKNSLNYTNEK